eukprot:s350_g32.t1
MTDFQKEETELTAQIDQAQQALAHAVRQFEASKNDISEEVVDVEAADAMRDVPESKDKEGTGNALAESLSSMSSRLAELQASAEAMVVEGEKKAKRQRTGAGSVPEGGAGSVPEGGASEVPPGMPSPSAPAMQAFPNRDAQSFTMPDKQ